MAMAAKITWRDQPRLPVTTDITWLIPISLIATPCRLFCEMQNATHPPILPEINHLRYHWDWPRSPITLRPHPADSAMAVAQFRQDRPSPPKSHPPPPYQLLAARPAFYCPSLTNINSSNFVVYNDSVNHGFDSSFWWPSLFYVGASLWFWQKRLTLKKL